MNQPSAEELRAFINERLNLLPIESAGIAKDILDRYLLIDKTEPIPGAVSVEDMYSDGWSKEATSDLIQTWDIYPKGTVARLMGEVGDLKIDIDTLRAEEQYRDYEKDQLQAEIDRLKASAEGWEKVAFENKRVAENKPEAVGCGKSYIEVRLGEFGEMLNCGDSFDDTTWICPDCQAKQKNEAVGCGKALFDICKRPLNLVCGDVECDVVLKCPDCQAKANHLECGEWYDTPPKMCVYPNQCPACKSASQAKANQPRTPESSKRVQLPEVPFKFHPNGGLNVVNMEQFFNEYNKLVDGYAAVKAHLEGKDE